MFSSLMDQKNKPEFGTLHSHISHVDLLVGWVKHNWFLSHRQKTILVTCTDINSTLTCLTPLIGVFKHVYWKIGTASLNLYIG